MRFFVRAVELVLERFPGVDVVRYVGDGHSEHHNLEKVLRDSNTGEWFETPAVRPEWMPTDCDLQWFVRKAWYDSTSLADICKAMAAEQQLNLMDNKIDVLQRIAIVGEENRELPALWTAERVHTRTGFIIRVKMLSDLSCQCFHPLIDIDALPEVIGACGKWIQVGLSIFSTVAPSEWIVSSSDLRAAFGIDKVLDQTVNVHNLIQGTDLKTNGFIDTSADCRLDSQQSRDLLRKLLEISCGRFEPRDVPSLSGLECGIVEASGVHVWATRGEMEKYPSLITRLSGFSLPSQMQAHIAGSLQCHIVICRVSDLKDWDWQKTYVEWSLADAADIQVAGGRTSWNPDKSKDPEWIDKRRFRIDSLDDFHMMTLTALTRRPLWPVKTIGGGTAQLADALRGNSLPTSCSIMIPLSKKGKVECEVSIEAVIP